MWVKKGADIMVKPLQCPLNIKNFPKESPSRRVSSHSIPSPAWNWLFSIYFMAAQVSQEKPASGNWLPLKALKRGAGRGGGAVGEGKKGEKRERG